MVRGTPYAEPRWCLEAGGRTTLTPPTRLAVGSSVATLLGSFSDPAERANVVDEANTAEDIGFVPAR